MFTYETDDGPANIRMVDATATRPAFAFVSGPGADELLDQLGDYGGFRSPESNTKAIFIDHSNVEEPDDDPLNTSLWGTPLRERIGLPKRVVVLPEKPEGDREEQLEWGSTISHEWVHVNGGEEVDAYTHEDAYRTRVGLAPKFDSDQALLDYIEKYYGEEELKLAARALGRDV